jgi:hypothetical protein
MRGAAYGECAVGASLGSAQSPYLDGRASWPPWRQAARQPGEGRGVVIEVGVEATDRSSLCSIPF